MFRLRSTLFFWQIEVFVLSGFSGLFIWIHVGYFDESGYILYVAGGVVTSI